MKRSKTSARFSIAPLILCAAIVTMAACAAPTTEVDADGKALSQQQRERRAQLIKDKKVDTWPRPGTNAPPVAVPLSVQECETLGGKLQVDTTCSFEITCVGANGGRVCISVIKS
jgi:hypothetical protein